MSQTIKQVIELYRYEKSENRNRKEVTMNINDIKIMIASMATPYKYKGYLPKDLEKHHVYYADSGHSIVCVLESHLDQAQKTDMEMYEVPVPVKYVIHNGYRFVNGHVIVDAPYDEFLGLVVDEKYRDYSLHGKDDSHKTESSCDLPEPLFVMVENNETELVASNYWETEYAINGLFYLSINAGAFRLMVPKSCEHLISEFKTGEYCIISKGPSIMPGHPFMIELLFEDHTDAPYHLILGPRHIDRNPLSSDAGKKYKMSIWTKGCKKVMEMDAYYRVVDRIPYLKPLGKEFKNVNWKGKVL